MADGDNFQEQQQNRAQRRLLFDGFNFQATNGGVNDASTRHQLNNPRHSPDLITDKMYTSPPEEKLQINNAEQDLSRFAISENSNSFPQSQQSCIIQLQNAKNLLHSMSRTNTGLYQQQQQSTVANIDNNNAENQLRNNEDLSVTQRNGQILMIDNPELSYYKSALESERARRSHSEKLIESQRLKLLEYEENLLQIKSSDMKKTLCMQQLEQMIPNIVDEWKQKELEYQKQLQQRDQRFTKVKHEKDQQFQENQLLHTQLKDKSEQIQQMIKDRERWKSEADQKQKDLSHIQQKLHQQETTNQQLKFEYEQVYLSIYLSIYAWLLFFCQMDDELKREISKLQRTIEHNEQDLEEKRVKLENVQKESTRVLTEHQTKIKQIELELDEQRRDNV
ncbi:unnamed protein product [Didymodactylos carnosus]|uniref:Uncharacterized protein n=1 Tax=Didymodactylos carnosus TaxID=1234261 RepID=A0A814SYQ4_9BILA|nr:unnamed protein product [Didymodactylos carnosus]CAF3917855.1 unnamed protein product [Didymodactylos carnosus]